MTSRGNASITGILLVALAVVGVTLAIALGSGASEPGSPSPGGPERGDDPREASERAAPVTTEATRSGAGSDATRQAGSAEARGAGKKKGEPPPPLPAPGTVTDEDRLVASYATRLGWPADDPRILEVLDWERERREVERELDQRIRAAGFERVLLEEYNDQSDVRRLELVRRVGDEAAKDVLKAIPLYRYDLDTGERHRVDAEGQRAEPEPDPHRPKDR